MKIWTGLRFLALGCQGELPPVSAGREELSPLVEGGDPRGEHDVEFFRKTQSTRLAGDVLSSQPLLQQVPGDGEAALLRLWTRLLRVVPVSPSFSPFMSLLCP